MLALFAFLNSLIMLLLGMLHLYWAVGGKWGLEQALPVSPTGEKPLNPGMIACIVVTLGLFAFSAFYFVIGLNGGTSLPVFLLKWMPFALAGIFLLRAIGDFKFVGFFKKIKNTEFGRLDTLFYSPLCLYIGLTTLWIGL